MMIREIDNYELIIPLWQEAFGDSREDIVFFTDNCENKKCIAYFNGDKLCAMLFLVACRCDNISGEYIYAACTSKKFRGNGYMSALIEFCISEYGNICLIPASDTLVNYYSARGLDTAHSVDSLEFDEANDIKEYLLEGYELTQPSALANF